MGRLQHRLIAAVVAMGILTGMSVVVADLAAPGSEVYESTALPPESRTRGDEAGALPNQTVPTRVTPPP